MLLDTNPTKTADSLKTPVTFTRNRPGVLVLLAEGATLERRGFIGTAQTSIGRQPDQQIYIHDLSLSRRHATIAFEGSRVSVRDEGSHNGTFVNGARIEGVHAASYGDIVRCGNTLVMPVPNVQAFDAWPTSADVPPLCGGLDIEPIRRTVNFLATHDVDVLVVGESGTGKEVVAQMLHGKRSGPLVSLNCAAVPENLFEAELFGVKKGAFTGATTDRKGLMEAARGGTLFLDEIGELPLSLQPKLLRAIERREYCPLGTSNTVRVDLRLVAATNRRLDEEVQQGRFRRDLFHRLCGVLVELPPLRKRKADIVVLTKRFLAEFTEEYGGEQPIATARFVERLLMHDWPGNVRELQRALRQALLQARMEGSCKLKVEHLRNGFSNDSQPSSEVLELREVLTRHKGNIRRAATELGVSRQRLYRLMRAYGYSPEDFR